MLKNWEQIRAEDAEKKLGIMFARPGTIVYSRDNGFMLETINYSDESNQWVYNCVNHDDWSELWSDGFGATPEEAYLNRKMY